MRQGELDEAFTAFVAARSRHLLQAAHLLTGDRHRAEDLLQTALTRAYLRWDRIVDEDPEGYVRRTMVNAHIDGWRRRPWREQPTDEVPDVAVPAGTAAVDARAGPARGAGDAVPAAARGRRAPLLRGPVGGRDRPHARLLAGHGEERRVAGDGDAPAAPGAAHGGGGVDLSDRLRAPELALEPSPAWSTRSAAGRGGSAVAAGAAGTALGVAAVLAGTTVLPGVLSASRTVPLATADRSYGVTTATSEVVLLERVNGADVVAFFEDDLPCASAIRVTRSKTCAQNVSPGSTAPFPALFDLAARGLRVDGVQLVGGLVQPQAVRVRLDLEEGPPVDAQIRRGEGFPFPVFFAELPRGAVVAAVVAVARDGTRGRAAGAVTSSAA